MKFLILTLALLMSCAGGYRGYNTPSCSKKSTKMMEDIMIMEYVRYSSQTEMCYSALGLKHYYITNDKEQPIDNCEPMPRVVNIECFSNCSTRFYSCLIFHEDGYVVQDVRRFGEEKFGL